MRSVQSPAVGLLTACRAELAEQALDMTLCLVQVLASRRCQRTCLTNDLVAVHVPTQLGS